MAVGYWDYVARVVDDMAWYWDNATGSTQAEAIANGKADVEQAASQGAYALSEGFGVTFAEAYADICEEYNNCYNS